jgi:DNA-binding transcriptional ArsR family regulator
MRLVEEDRAMECLKVDAEKIGALSEERTMILELLSEKPHYPAELARALELPVQTIYYHIKILEKAGFLEFTEYEERNGGIAKRYRSKAESVAVVINPAGWKKADFAPKRPPAILRPFIKSGYFDGQIIVGSPEPHGKYRARASEFGMLELAMYLGQFATFDFPLYRLDVRLDSEMRKRNLIVAGGPKVNTLVHEINNDLPISFDEKNFIVHSSISGKKYEENVGVIELIKNPYNADAKILLIGGLNHHGTRAAVIAIVKKSAELGVKDGKKAFAKVVQGYDENGDGIVDSVDILE